MTIKTQAGWWVALIGCMIAALSVLTTYVVFRLKEGDDFEFKDVAAVSAAPFFLYQILAGAFFATTSITLEGKRLDSKRILVKATIERGDQWLVQIDQDLYAVGEQIKLDDWKTIGFLRRTVDGRVVDGKSEK